VAERVADAGLERLHDPVHRHADADAERQGDDDERDERIELVPRDQDDEYDDRDGGVDEKLRALDQVGRSLAKDRRSLEPIRRPR
jgi:hypothetical protein